MSNIPEMQGDRSLQRRLWAAASIRRTYQLNVVLNAILFFSFGLLHTLWMQAPVSIGWKIGLVAGGCAVPILGCLLRRKSEYTNNMLLGDVLWTAALLVQQPKITCCLLIAGLMLMGIGLVRLVPVMKEAAQLVDPEAGNTFITIYQMTAAIGAAIGWIGWLIPAGIQVYVGLALAVILLVCILNIPADRRYAHKLHRYLTECRDNEPLRKRLEWVFVEKHRRPWLVLVIEWLLRWVYRYQRKDVQEIREDEDNPLIYLCNHGELYGPVSCVLHIPSYVRPWSISYIMVDHAEASEYMHRYTFGEHNKLVPEPLKWPMAHLVSRISIWAMNQCLEAVPVFRDKPRQLMNTFRISSDVLVSGDQLLIFPENPNAVCQDHGYEREGVGELFSGFAMIAPIYYNRTGKRARFMPMYAHQGNRTLSFGHEIQYDPDADPTDERNRLVAAIDAEMHRLYDREEAIYRAKHK